MSTNKVTPPRKIPDDLITDFSKNNFFSKLTETLYQVWLVAGGQNGGKVPYNSIDDDVEAFTFFMGS